MISGYISRNDSYRCLTLEPPKVFHLTRLDGSPLRPRGRTEAPLRLWTITATLRMLRSWKVPRSGAGAISVTARRSDVEGGEPTRASELLLGSDAGNCRRVRWVQMAVLVGAGGCTHSRRDAPVIKADDAAPSITARASLFMRAARGERVERTPVWFMRQAGRVLPEYRKVREQWSLIEICRQPELCAEVTLQPVHRFKPDAAILFCDIMLPLLGSGVSLELVDDVGPVIRSPVRDWAGVNALRPLVPEHDVPFVLETIRIVRQSLGGAVPLIGFSGAPFTLASYLIEGRPSRDFAQTKTMMYGAPELWHELMDRLATLVITYLQAQVNAGVDALQLFDS